MNRIFTLAIASTLIIAGSNVFAQQLPKSPRQVQRQAEAISYATENSSNVPRYRGYRQPSVIAAPKTAAPFVRHTHQYDEPQQLVDPQPTLVLAPPSSPQTFEAAPEIRSSSHRITMIKVPIPATEVSVSAWEAIPPARTQTDVMKTRTPAKASPDFKHLNPADYGQQDLQQSVWKPWTDQVQREENTALSLPFEQPQTTEAAPVISSSSRQITRMKVPTPKTVILSFVADPIQPDQTQTDVVKTKAPAEASPSFKYPSPSDFGEEDVQQSRSKPLPNPFQSARKVSRSSPVEPLETIDLPDFFEAVTPVVAAKNKAVAVPLKAVPVEVVPVETAENSPLTSSIAKTATPPTVETESTIEVVAPAASATTGLATKANVRTPKEVHTSAGRETSRQRKAAGAWWFFLPLLLVPFLAWLGWTRLVANRNDLFEIAPSSVKFEISQTPHVPRRSPDAFEKELLDEVNSIRTIPTNSNSAASSTLDFRAISENR